MNYNLSKPYINLVNSEPLNPDNRYVKNKVNSNDNINSLLKMTKKNDLETSNNLNSRIEDNYKSKDVMSNKQNTTTIMSSIKFENNLNKEMVHVSNKNFNSKPNENSQLHDKLKDKDYYRMPNLKGIKIDSKAEKKQINIFKTGIGSIARSQIKDAQKNSKFNFESIIKNPNKLEKKMPFVFEFNYEKRKNDNTIKELTFEFIENHFIPVKNYLSYYNTKCQNSLLKQTNLMYKSK